MCWAIKVIGKREAVRKQIEKSTFVPESVRAVILDHIQDETTDGTNGVRIEGEGDSFTSGSHYRGITKLEIEHIQIIE